MYWTLQNDKSFDEHFNIFSIFANITHLFSKFMENSNQSWITILLLKKLVNY